MKDAAPCPMCSQRFESRTDLRVHLMCEHRKSAITDELLATVDREQDATRTIREARETRPVGLVDVDT